MRQVRAVGWAGTTNQYRRVDDYCGDVVDTAAGEGSEVQVCIRVYEWR